MRGGAGGGGGGGGGRGGAGGGGGGVHAECRRYTVNYAKVKVSSRSAIRVNAAFMSYHKVYSVMTLALTQFKHTPAA